METLLQSGGSGNKARPFDECVFKKRFPPQGACKKMLELLIEEAKSRKVTEISLDATEKGRPLYESMGFCCNDSAMAMKL
nr:GNAT family N-acetyltransferase [Treponema succinifaciens]